MTREFENELEEVLDELSRLGNSDELSDVDKGMLKSAEGTVAKVLSRKRNARHLNEWP